MMKTAQQQHDEDVADGQMLSAKLDKALTRLEAYRRDSLAAQLRGEEIEDFDHECRRLWDRIVVLQCRRKSAGKAAIGRFKDRVGEEACEEVARALVKEMEDDKAGEH